MARALLLVGGGLCAFGAAAQSAPAAAPPPVESFFSSPDIGIGRLSPSGEYLAITTSKNLVRRGLFVFNLKNPGKVQTAAYFPDFDVVSFNWVNNTQMVFQVGDLKQAVGKQEVRGSGLYSTNIDGSELRQLVRRRAERVEGERIASRVLPANHWLLHVLPPNLAKPIDEVIVGEGQWDENGELVRVVPHWVNIKTGLKRRMDVQVPPGTTQWVFDPSGTPRVAVARREDRQAILWKPRDGDWTQIGEGDVFDLAFTPVAVDGEDQLYVTRPEGAAGTLALTRFNFKKGVPDSDVLVRTPGFDFSGNLIQAPGTGELLGVSMLTDARATLWWNPAMRKVQADIDAKLPGRANLVSCGSRCGDPDMPVALVYSYTDRDPGQFLLYTPADGSLRLLARTKSDIDPSSMARVDLQRIKARDGREIPVWLTLPKGRKAGEPGPTVVMVHGGPWVRGGEWGWAPMEQFLASRGYTVISPEFRGSMGYGTAHYRAGWKQWGTAMQDDVADTVLWAQQQKLADHRVCIAGASYGGYSTLMSLIRHPELYRCGVAWVAVSDPFLLVKRSSTIEDDSSDLSRRGLLSRIGDPEADAELLTQASPLAQAARLKAPLLLAMGEADVRVPLAHGTRMRDALEKAGNPPIWVSYPNEGHSWTLPATHVDFAKRVERFLGEHLGGGAKPAP